MDMLDSENIFTDEELDKILGGISADDQPGEDQENETNEETQEDEPVVEDFDDEFSDHDPKSVGNGTEPPAPQSGSPTPTNLFHSIAAALREEGVFPDTDDDTVDSVTDAASFRKLVEDQIAAGLSDVQRRINEALQYGVQPNEIQEYEGALHYLNNITEDALASRSEEGETLRKKLIYQDLMNRGYSHEKALKEIKKSLDAGTDIDDAKDAYTANKQFFQGRYQALIDQAKQQRQQAEQQYNSRAEKFRKSLMEDKTVFGNVDIDEGTRRRVYDVLTKPTKRGEDGRYHTELQWAQASNSDDFSRNVGLLYVLTNGFKDVEKLISPQVKKRTSRGLAELERVINDTQRNNDGSLRLMNGVNTDQESFFDDIVDM